MTSERWNSCGMRHAARVALCSVALLCSVAHAHAAPARVRVSAPTAVTLSVERQRLGDDRVMLRVQLIANQTVDDVTLRFQLPSGARVLSGQSSYAVSMTQGETQWVYVLLQASSTITEPVTLQLSSANDAVRLPPTHDVSLASELTTTRQRAAPRGRLMLREPPPADAPQHIASPGGPINHALSAGEER